MKKIVMLVFIVMIMAFVTAVQAEVRAGGLPALIVDDSIKDCAGPCPPPPVVEQKVEVPVPPPPPEVKQEVEPPPVVAAKPVIIEKGRQTLNVEFDFDKSTIKKGYYQDIDNLAGVMKQYPDLNVVIEGHTDSMGTAAYNKKLSQRRAESVKKYMVEKGGIDANRIKAIGFGEEKPIASNDTDEGRQQNRRVEAAVDYLIEK
jgi:OOP family OmpA-OmpF porin